MTSAATSMHPTAAARPWTPLQAVLAGGLFAAVGDFVAAMLIWGISWQVVGHAIAAGWLGKEAAKDSGVPGALLGAASHTGILLVAAAIYVFASRRLTILARWPLVFGPLFGFGVFLVMNYVVVPLSAAPRPGVNPLEMNPAKPWDLASHFFLVGTPIALAAWKARKR
jgi:hypothetical protein